MQWWAYCSVFTALLQHCTDSLDPLRTERTDRSWENYTAYVRWVLLGRL